MLFLLIVVAILLGYVAYRLILRGRYLSRSLRNQVRKEPGPEDYLRRLKELQQRNQDF